MHKYLEVEAEVRYWEDSKVENIKNNKKINLF